MKLTERKRIYLCVYAETDDILQRYKFKSVDSKKNITIYMSTISKSNY